MFVQAQAVVLAPRAFVRPLAGVLLPLSERRRLAKIRALDLPIWNYAAPPATVTLVQIYRRWLTARKAGVCTKSHADCDLPRFLRRTGGEGNPKKLVEAASRAFPPRSIILTIRDSGEIVMHSLDCDHCGMRVRSAAI